MELGHLISSSIFFSGLLLYMGGCPVYMLMGLQVEVQANT